MNVDDARLREVDAIASRVRLLSESRGDVQAAIVVGSYAYGRPRLDSDIDIVMAVVDRRPWLSDDAWVSQLLAEPLELVRGQAWGPLHERRFRTGSGFEVEFGLVTSEWFATPVDPGTARVLTDGCLILADRHGLARDALRWLAVPAAEWIGVHEGGSTKPPERQLTVRASGVIRGR
ncbi:nucleotidyltransferase domain-containing protein [Nocardioides sp.]|uniref:nucleotidyltransferase domain-containing protein n=1 Tax=Nocardioides sp. TaxID=35761 RepID=UPI0027369BF2|nr:nucleotidyltransferase domain-containing protein [Nocardioides sp.]MDP3893755.1 nucleotidyltransferase domain-containing protein [Nocardioides sp.]